MTESSKEGAVLCHFSFNHIEYCTFARGKGGVQAPFAPPWIATAHGGWLCMIRQQMN